MVTLHSTTTIDAVANVHVELPVDRPARNLHLILLFDSRLFYLPGTTRAGAGQFGLTHLVDLIIGARDADPNGDRSGESYVGFGKNTGFSAAFELNSLLVTNGGDGNDGSYSFVDLRPGTYTLTESQPVNFLDGVETVGNLGGTVDNTQDSNVIDNITVLNDVPGYNFAEIRPSEIVGLVWEDFNDDGEVVTINLAGSDDRGNAVNASDMTDNEGIYMFMDLRPSNANGYTITEMQPPDSSMARPRRTSVSWSP